MKHVTLFIVGVLLIAARAGAEHVRQEDYVAACERVFFEKGYDPKLAPMEARLVCGDDAPDQVGRPWADVPPSQARFFLRTFLQARGFHGPDFNIEGDRLYVRPGRRTEATAFEIVRPPPQWRQPRKRSYKGEPLTPGLLNSLEAWTLTEIKNAGYACGEVGAVADPGTGLIRMEIDAGDRKKILDAFDIGETELNPGVLDRYNAFRIGDYYSDMLVQLTRRRLLADGLLQAVSFSTDCYPNGVLIRRDPMMGPPREVRLGIGGNTDDGFRFRARAKQIRLGPTASSAEASLDASFRRQEASLLGRWHYSGSSTRDFLEPEVVFERLDERQIESRAWQVSARHGWNRELASGKAELRLGPAWQISEILRGIGPGEVTIIFLEGNLQWMQHVSEFFGQSPRTGSRFEFDLVQTQKDWGSPFTASRGRLRGQTLWNILRYDPPAAVVGVRYSLGTTWTDHDIDATALPIRFRFFAGGTDDLRGFDRQSLPRSGNGALTEALGSLEIRFYKALFDRVDPLVFVDGGKMGLRAVRLERTTYVSPGIGLRWESPFGTFRGFVAEGRLIEPPPGLPGPYTNWRLGFSYGEEF